MGGKLLGGVFIGGGLALAATGAYIGRNADAPPHDFHGNSVHDPRGFKKLGSTGLMLAGLFFAGVLGPMMLMTG